MSSTAVKTKIITVEDLVIDFCESRLIALNGKDGKQLFDTRKNTRDYISKYYKGRVLDIWADMANNSFGGFSPSLECVIKCYVSNDSWNEVRNEIN